MIKTVYKDGKYSKLFPYLFICVAVLLAYLPSFTGDFILDDGPLIINNSYIREWHSISSYVFQEDGYDVDSHPMHTGYYRPLLNLSYTLDLKIWGLSGPGFRITNLILHSLVCFALLSFYNLILQKKYLSLFLVLLFSLHPINTETVSWVAARNNLLVTLFGILSLHYYIKSYRDRNYFHYIISIVFFVLAIFSKEFGLMLLPIFFLYQRTLNTQKQDIVIELREYIPYIIIGVCYFALRQNATGSIITPEGFSDNLIRILNFPYVFFLNLKLIFLPYNLHSYIIKYPESVINIGTLSGILLFILIICLLLIYRKNSVVLFSVLAFFFAILPVGGIIPISAPSLTAMRWLYFPSIFILIILAHPLEKLIQFKKRISLFLFACIVLYLGVNSYTLNKLLWHSSDNFFEQEVLHFNNNFYADGLAQIYYNEKKFKLAEKYFEKNFESGVNRAINYLEYSQLLMKKGEIESSLSFLNKAELYCVADNEFGALYHNRGLAYLELDDLDRAGRNFRKAVIFSPEESVYWENLGVVYGKMGYHTKAIDSFKKGIRIGTSSKSIRKNLAYAYISINNCEKALSIIERLKYGDNNIDVDRLLEDANKCMDVKS
ncbi:tetratricopeptide repeat protein [Thermodesulfobacteriota bacterium]